MSDHFVPYDPATHDNNQNGNDLDPPADGTHTGCELIDASAFTAKNGKDFVKFQWRAPHGHTWTVLQGFGSDAQAGVTWGQVAQLGINPTEISDLEQLNGVLTSHIGSYYDIGVKTNGQFRNSYINGPSVGSNPVVQEQIASNGVQTPAAVSADGADDNTIPF